MHSTILGSTKTDAVGKAPSAQSTSAMFRSESTNVRAARKKISAEGKVTHYTQHCRTIILFLSNNARKCAQIVDQVPFAVSRFCHIGST